MHLWSTPCPCVNVLFSSPIITTISVHSLSALYTCMNTLFFASYVAVLYKPCAHDHVYAWAPCSWHLMSLFYIRFMIMAMSMLDHLVLCISCSLLYIWRVISLSPCVIILLSTYILTVIHMTLWSAPISMCGCPVAYCYGHCYPLNSRLDFLLTILIIFRCVLSCHMLTPMISVTKTTSGFSNSILFHVGRSKSLFFKLMWSFGFLNPL